MLKKYKEFINETRVVSFDNEKDGNFVVVVGGAGSGKSFVSSNLLNLRDFKRISVDTFREMLAKKLGLNLGNPKDNTTVLKMTGGSSDPKNPTIKNIKNILGARNNLPNIIFDAGGSQKGIIKTIAEMAENIGYTTTLVYVKTDLEKALKRNLEREGF